MFPRFFRCSSREPPSMFLLYFNVVHLFIKGPRWSCIDDLDMFSSRINFSSTAARWTEWLSILQNAPTSRFLDKKKTILFDYSMLGFIIEGVNHVKDLGLIMDSQLTYHQHVSYTVDRASWALGFIFGVAKIRHPLPEISLLFSCVFHAKMLPCNDAKRNESVWFSSFSASNIVLERSIPSTELWKPLSFNRSRVTPQP